MEGKYVFIGLVFVDDGAAMVAILEQFGHNSEKGSRPRL
jgi:hypothetical protein